MKSNEREANNLPTHCHLCQTPLDFIAQLHACRGTHILDTTHKVIVPLGIPCYHCRKTIAPGESYIRREDFVTHLVFRFCEECRSILPKGGK